MLLFYEPITAAAEALGLVAALQIEIHTSERTADWQYRDSEHIPTILTHYLRRKVSAINSPAFEGERCCRHDQLVKIALVTLWSNPE